MDRASYESLASEWGQLVPMTLNVKVDGPLKNAAWRISRPRSARRFRIFRRSCGALFCLPDSCSSARLHVQRRAFFGGSKSSSPIPCERRLLSRSCKGGLPNMATYHLISEHVRRTEGFVPKTCGIADVKERNGLPVQRASNRAGGDRQVPCPLDKRPAIERALRHFGMLSN